MSNCTGDVCKCGMDEWDWGDLPYGTRVGVQFGILILATAMGGVGGFAF